MHFVGLYYMIILQCMVQKTFFFFYLGRTNCSSTNPDCYNES